MSGIWSNSILLQISRPAATPFLNGPLIKTVDRKEAPLAFFQKVRPQLFLMHRLDPCIKRRELRLKLPRSVPLAPPPSFECFYEAVAAPRNDPRRLRRAKILRVVCETKLNQRRSPQAVLTISTQKNCKACFCRYARLTSNCEKEEVPLLRAGFCI